MILLRNLNWVTVELEGFDV